MEVPLVVKSIENKGKEQFEIWYNNKKKIIDSPINPFFYSYERDLGIDELHVKKLDATPLSNTSSGSLSEFQTKPFYKHSFKTRKELVHWRNAIGMSRSFESNIPFVVRNRLENPDVWKNYPNTDRLKFIFLDISFI